MDFKFKINSDIGEVGVVALGATDGINGDFRVRIDATRHSVLRFHIERLPLMSYRSQFGNEIVWDREYVYCLDIENLNKNFDVTLTGRHSGDPWMDFYWLSFNFKMTPDGLMMTKTGEPNTLNACNLSNDTLDVMILQKGIILNNFNLTVIRNMLKRKKEKE